MDRALLFKGRRKAQAIMGPLVRCAGWPTSLEAEQPLVLEEASITDPTRNMYMHEMVSRCMHVCFVYR